jgi:hypothetical protein
VGKRGGSGSFFSDWGEGLDERIKRNEDAVSGVTRFRKARESWSDALADEQMCVPIETLLSDDYYWGKENIWPAVRDEMEEIWHLRCDFDVTFLRQGKILKRQTIYALSYHHAERRARQMWPRQADECDQIYIRRDRDLHSVIIECPKGTGKDYEASIIIALLVREYLIQPRNVYLELYNIDPATTISINLMNRSEEQAKKVTFSEVLKRVNNDFFLDYFPTQVTLEEIESSGRMPMDLKFPKNIVVFPGSGAASTGLGYTLGAEIIDECNFMQQSDTSKKSIMGAERDKYDAAEEAYDDGIVRHRSRFGAMVNGNMIVAGLIVAISSTRLTTDFTQRMEDRAKLDPGIFYSSTTFWGRKPLNLSGESFQFDIANMRIINPELAKKVYAEVRKPPMEDLVAQ